MELLKLRNNIAQAIVDMNILEERPVRSAGGLTFDQTIALIEEVNESKPIGHALVIKDGKIKKYRKTYIEKLLKL